MPSFDVRRTLGLPSSAPQGARAAMKAALAAELGLPRAPNAPNVRDSLLRRLIIDVHGAGFADLGPDVQLARAATVAAIARQFIGNERAVVVLFEDSGDLHGCSVRRRVEYVFQAAGAEP